MALAAAGGTLYFLGHVGWGVWPCLLVCLAPLWWALESVRSRSLAVSCLLGLTFGLAAYAGGFHALWPLVDTFLEGRLWLGVVLWTAYGVWFALAFAVYAALVRAIRKRGWPLALAGVAPLVLVEWLHPQIFPVYAGAALVRAPLWSSQAADLGGPLLLTALAAGANVLTFETCAWAVGRRRRPDAVWAIGSLATLVAIAYGHVRIATLDAAALDAPALRVGLVQANLDPHDAPRLGVVAHRQHLALTRELLAAGPLDLVVWPESAYGRGIRRPLPVSGQPVAAELGVPILFGGTSVRQEGGRRVRYNSAFMVGDDGMIRTAYDKNLLVPLAEQAPLPGVRSWLPTAGTFRAARDTPSLTLGAWRIATPICYEAIRPAFVRRMAAHTHPHLFVTLANDAYFGDSQEPWMHLALARLRAVEHRRYVVRATNSGVSAIVDPTGRVRAATALQRPATLRASVRLYDTPPTLYARVGDWPGWLSAALVALTACVSRGDQTTRMISTGRRDSSV